MASASLKHHDHISQYLRRQVDKVREQIMTAWIDHDRVRTSLLYYLTGKIDEVEELIDDDIPIKGEYSVSNKDMLLERFKDALDQLTLLMGQQFKAIHDLKEALGHMTQFQEEQEDN